MKPSALSSNQTEAQSISDPKHPTLSPHIDKLKQLILTHRKDVSDFLLSHKRTRLAKLIAGLPANAVPVHTLCLNDLPVAAEALGLSSLALACDHARAGELVKAVQAADHGIIMLGPETDFLRFIEEAENCMASSALIETKYGAQKDAVQEPIMGSEDKVPISLPNHLSGSCAEVCADDFTTDAFREFFKRDEPVVIRSCARWKALKHWRMLSYWERYGHRIIPVEQDGNDGKMTETFLPLHEVIKAMVSSRRVYMAQHALLSQIPALFDDIEIPVYTQIDGGADVINVWMGSSATGSKLHHDSADNILVQIVGHKTVVLIPPDEPVYAKSSNFSPVDIERPDYDMFPMFEHVVGKKVDLSPGDGLYIPAGYWHYVRSRTSSISVNFWF